MAPFKILAGRVGDIVVALSCGTLIHYFASGNKNHIMKPRSHRHHRRHNCGSARRAAGFYFNVSYWFPAKIIVRFGGEQKLVAKMVSELSIYAKRHSLFKLSDTVNF